MPDKPAVISSISLSNRGAFVSADVIVDEGDEKMPIIDICLF
ncbi:hypothetical protein BH18THE2_BH18THE2_14650 [soil metagenome]